MNEEPKKEEQATTPEPQPHKVGLPGWLVKEEIGLGHVIKSMTYRAGIKACGGCERRAAAFDRWMVFYPK